MKYDPGLRQRLTFGNALVSSASAELALPRVEPTFPCLNQGNRVRQIVMAWWFRPEPCSVCGTQPRKGA